MTTATVTARTDYNEYLTLEQNEAINRELFTPANEILDQDEREIDLMWQEIEKDDGYDAEVVDEDND